jgi:hypothetical protein
MQLIVDRFEGPWAILETSDGATINFPSSLLPAAAKEGDVLKIEISLDEETSRERRQRIQQTLEDLKSKDEGGNIEL